MSRRPASRQLEWLDLLEISGPFLSPPVINRVFPQGLDVLDTDPAAKLRLARDDWADSQPGPNGDPQVHSEWIRLVLTETLGFTPDVLLHGAAIPQAITLEVPEYQTAVLPDFVLAEPPVEGRPREARFLIQVYPRDQKLDDAVSGSNWATAPSTRMTQLCRATGIRLGLVTNGERWMLVDAPVGETSAYVSWYASLWSQEPDTLRAFRSLLHARRFFGVDKSETLEVLLADSASYQTEVTEQLGAQVRRAIEVLVRALDRADADTGRQLLANVGEFELYEAGITVMMRLVFLFFAEESGLLLLGDETYDQFYSASMLRGQLREEADRVGLEVLERRQDAWSRLLATFRAIYAGVDHEALHLPGYGGSLFDPDRFAFLEGRAPGTSWVDTDSAPLPIDNRTVLHVLDALQVLQTGGRGGEARKLSFRALDIEQIGHVYESLLDHMAVRASNPIVGLVGPPGAEPEVSLDDLDAGRDRGHQELLEFLARHTKKSMVSLTRALERAPDPEVIDRLRVVCADEKLLTRILPYCSLIRDDPWGDPIVVPSGAIFVTAGRERRGTGTYYTPRALTEEVVTYALEPIVYRGPAEGKPREEWELKAPGELLELKVCDFAMGSGAFLVQVCRWLGERLVESWERAGANEELITPYGGRPTGGPSDTVVPRGSEERRAMARRLIADRCVYGVDVNPLAVEMAKLSLWLVTLARARPFSFLDHALTCGDSLLGVHDLAQIRNFHLDPAEGRNIHATLFDPTRHIEPAIQKALQLRQQLESFEVLDVQDARQKAALHEAAEAAVERLRVMGDLIVGAAISTAEAGTDSFDGLLSSLTDRLFSGRDGATFDEAVVDDAKARLNGGKSDTRPTRRPFHWPLEFPEVFLRERQGFDAIIGNPPFQGGKRISGALGSDYREYLVKWLANDRKGTADLVTYFFLRATRLAASHGTIGLLATNTVAQGDTREVGLDQILASGWEVMRAWRSRPWPGDAGVSIAEVWLHHGRWLGTALLDGSAVSTISPALQPVSRVRGQPLQLAANERRSFYGTVISGDGFIIAPELAESLVARRAANRQVLAPYLTGADLMSRPDQTPSRLVIDFGGRTLHEAAAFPECLEIVEHLVKPVRDKVKRASYRTRWWQFAERCEALYAAISTLERVIVFPQTAKYLLPSVVPSNRRVFAQTVIVLAFSDDAHFGVVASVLHGIWALEHGSTLETRPCYRPSDVFRTYPFPVSLEGIAPVANELRQMRATVMAETQSGLTRLYNRIHDPADQSPEVNQIRDTHRKIDYAVRNAYNWTDLPFEHDFYDGPQGVRYTLAPAVRVELLDRLLELNYERARNQRGQGPSMEKILLDA